MSHPYRRTFPPYEPTRVPTPRVFNPALASMIVHGPPRPERPVEPSVAARESARLLEAWRGGELARAAWAGAKEAEE